MLQRILHKIRQRTALKRGFIPWKGGILFFPPGSIIAESVLNKKVWEEDVTRLIQMSTANNSVVFDVGANIGVTALEILDWNPSVRVMSFEPSPTVLSNLQMTIEKSSFRSRWLLCENAVTSRHGDVLDFSIQACPGRDVYEGLVDTGRGGATRTVQVKTTTIDHEWVKLDRPKVSVIKIDVEGAELAVLNGAVSCVAANQPVIVTEWCDKNFKSYGMDGAEIFLWCDKANYDAFVIPELYPLDQYSSGLKLQLATHENLLLVPKKANS